MRATFFGFESIRKALMASQKGLDVTSQNVSNVNTEGYTRQRVDVASISPDTGATRYAKVKGDSVGQGVEVAGITQIRDQFLDVRYRKEIADYGKWSAGLAVATDVENVIDEASTNGLNARLNDLYSQLQSFSVNAESVEFSSIFRSSAQKVIEVFNQYSRQLTDLKDQYIFNAGTEVTDANQTVAKIAELNTQIKGELMQGSRPNELMDKRNLMLDKLSNLIGTSYEFTSDGQVSVKLGSTYLLDSQKNNQMNELTLNSSGSPVNITLNDGSDAHIITGSIGGYLSSINGKGTFADPAVSTDDSSKGLEYFQKSLDALAKAFSDNFNGLNDATGVKKLFIASDGSATITAKNIKISAEWMADPQFITRSDKASPKTGDNDTLLKMITSMDSEHSVTPNFSGTFEQFVVSLIGDMAVEVKYNKDMQGTSENVLSTISDQRESITGVSIDEETINMQRFQKSYNAAARIMTVMDEMLDVLINRMGTVGR